MDLQWIAISTDWKSISYDLILVIVGVHNESVQILIDAPGLRRSVLPLT